MTKVYKKDIIIKNKRIFFIDIEYNIYLKKKGIIKMLSNSLLIIDGSALLSKYYYGTIPKELFSEKNQEKIKELQKQIKQTSYGTCKKI